MTPSPRAGIDEAEGDGRADPHDDVEPERHGQQTNIRLGFTTTETYHGMSNVHNNALGPTVCLIQAIICPDNQNPIQQLSVGYMNMYSNISGE